MIFKMYITGHLTNDLIIFKIYEALHDTSILINSEQMSFFYIGLTMGVTGRQRMLTPLGILFLTCPLVCIC
jgi:hypothetical protein